MKAVFPCAGVAIVTKYSINTLKDFYENNLINSKLFGIYQQSNYYMQAGNFNYFPKKSNIVLEQAHLLTLQKLQEVVAKQVSQSNTTSTHQQTPQISNEPLDDNFVKNNAFFETLAKLN